MKRMIIVDDEAIIKTVLRTVINWEDMGITIVGYASNGHEALELWADLKPDILLTDIRMPVLDGIGLIKEVKKLDEDIPIIVLSSYDDFELVREAFQLGAFDYLLKSEMDEKSVKELFVKLKGHLGLQSKKSEQHMNLKNIVHENRQDIINAFYKKLIWEEQWDAKIMEKKIIELNLRFQQENVVLCLVKVKHSNDGQNTHNEYNTRVLSSSIISTIEMVLDEFQLGDVFSKSESEYVVVLSLKQHKSQLEQIYILQNICNVIRNRLLQYMNIKSSIAISNIANKGKGDYLSVLYKECERALENVFFTGFGQVLFYNMITYGKEQQKLDYSKRIKKLRELIDNERPENEFEDILFKCDEDVICVSADEIRWLYDGYIWNLSEYVDKNNFNQSFKNDFKEKLNHYTNVLKKHGNLAELNDLLRIIYKSVRKAQAEDNSLVEAAKRYIRTYYSHSISLKDAAEHLHVSEEHLCRIFSEGQEVSFMKYLMEVRVEKAKELLIRGDLKIYEVSEKVGYTSVEYFSKMFKNFTGKTPLQFSRLK